MFKNRMNKTERRRRMFNGVGISTTLYGLYIMAVIVWVGFRAIAQAMGPVM